MLTPNLTFKEKINIALEVLNMLAQTEFKEDPVDKRQQSKQVDILASIDAGVDEIPEYL